MSEKTDSLLTRGLKAGFAGGTEMQNTERGGFKIKSSHFENDEGIYHDEWFADIAGGGQEIVKVGEEVFTRVYAGGTISLENLAELGTSKGEVMNFLKKNIIDNGDKIRLHTDFYPEPNGDWQYSYQVLEENLDIRITLGKEVIKFKGLTVFIHDFLICPVE